MFATNKLESSLRPKPGLEVIVNSSLGRWPERGFHPVALFLVLPAPFWQVRVWLTCQVCLVVHRILVQLDSGIYRSVVFYVVNPRMPVRMDRRCVVVPKRFVYHPSVSTVPAVQRLLLKELTVSP